MSDAPKPRTQKDIFDLKAEVEALIDTYPLLRDATLDDNLKLEQLAQYQEIMGGDIPMHEAGHCLAATPMPPSLLPAKLATKTTPDDLTVQFYDFESTPLRHSSLTDFSALIEESRFFLPDGALSVFGRGIEPHAFNRVDAADIGKIVDVSYQGGVFSAGDETYLRTQFKHKGIRLGVTGAEKAKAPAWTPEQSPKIYNGKITNYYGEPLPKAVVDAMPQEQKDNLKEPIKCRTKPGF